MPPEHQVFPSRSDVRSRCLLFAAAVTASFLFTSPIAHLTLSLGAVAVAAGFRLRALTRLLAPLATLLVLILLFAALIPSADADPRVLVTLWPDGPSVTSGGLLHGAILVSRIVTMVGASAALLRTTPVEQFTALLQMLRAPNVMVFLVTTALRFIPTLRMRSSQIRDAQRVRGARLGEGGPVARIKASATIMIPLLTCGIRMSEQLSTAMLSRGYGITRQPTRLITLTWSWRDSLVTLAAIALVVVAIAV